MKSTLLIRITVCILLSSTLSACKKDVAIDKLTIFLAKASGNYIVHKRTVVYCLPCPPVFQVKDSIYSDSYILTVSSSGNQLEIAVKDSSGNFGYTPYSFTSQLDCCPPLDENLEYDPDVRFNYQTSGPHDEHNAQFYSGDSVYVTFENSGLGGQSYTYYYGTKLP